MKALRSTLAFSCLLAMDIARCVQAADKPSDKEPLSDFMVGTYELIGRKPDSTVTYSGKVTLRAEGNRLQVIRTVAGKTCKCTAHFDTIAGDDRIPVLRMRFVLENIEYQASYLWQPDPDNYFRFTGKVYRLETKAAGLEALFPVHK